MWEFMKDEVEGPVQVMDEFIRPILTEALAQKAKNPEAKSAEVAEGETLLEHLVNLTDGENIICIFPPLCSWFLYRSANHP